MLMPGDVIDFDLGVPAGSEAGLRRPAIVVTAARVLRGEPSVVQVVPLTRAIRASGAEVVIEPDGRSGLRAASAPQCQHIRSVSVGRMTAPLGNIGPVALSQVRDTVALLLDL